MIVVRLIAARRLSIIHDREFHTGTGHRQSINIQYAKADVTIKSELVTQTWRAPEMAHDQPAHRLYLRQALLVAQVNVIRKVIQ